MCRRGRSSTTFASVSEVKVLLEPDAGGVRHAGINDPERVRQIARRHAEAEISADATLHGRCPVRGPDSLRQLPGRSPQGRTGRSIPSAEASEATRPGLRLRVVRRRPDLGLPGLPHPPTTRPDEGQIPETLRTVRHSRACGATRATANQERSQDSQATLGPAEKVETRRVLSPHPVQARFPR